MTSKFEQLIEYVINDEEAKARELFHDIVVEKSREIYEDLMDEETHDEKADDRAERDAEKVKKDLEYDYKHGRKVKEDGTSGSAAEDLMREVETEESGMAFEDDDEDAEFDDEAEEAGHDVTKDMEADHDEMDDSEDMEDRVVDLEDKLDELMAEFEALMGNDETMMSRDDEVGGDAYAQDDTEEFVDMPVSENINLKKAPAPVTTEPAGTQTRSTVAVNSGAKGMQGKPVGKSPDEPAVDGKPIKAPTNYADKGRGNLPGAGTFKNVPAKDGSKLAPAPKPVTAQAAGVNTRPVIS